MKPFGRGSSNFMKPNIRRRNTAAIESPIWQQEIKTRIPRLGLFQPFPKPPPTKRAKSGKIETVLRSRTSADEAEHPQAFGTNKALGNDVGEIVSPTSARIPRRRSLKPPPKNLGNRSGNERKSNGGVRRLVNTRRRRRAWRAELKKRLTRELLQTK